MSAVTKFPRKARVLGHLEPEQRCTPTCLTWHLVNPDTDPELQRCDACWEGVDDPLTDADVARLPEARIVLRVAHDQLAAKRELARSRRRTAVIRGNDVLSTCCGANVLVNAVTVTVLAFDIERDTDGAPIVRQIVQAAHGAVGTEPDMIEPDLAVCSQCGRKHNLPDGLVP